MVVVGLNGSKMTDYLRQSDGLQVVCILEWYLG